MTTLSETVPAALAGQRLDRVVAMVTGLSRAESAALVSAGAVAVDDTVVNRGAARLVEDQQVRIDVPEAVEDPLPAPDAGVLVPVIYDDEDVIVVDKPADLVVHAGAGNHDGTLVNGLLARFPEVAGVGDPQRPGIVHRLDRGTSGLLMVARSPRAYDALVGQLARRSVQRRYRTLVWGHPESPRGLIEAPIGRSVRHPTRMAVTTDGKEARTRYEVEATYGGPGPLALMRCRLETGRTHQIRVHLAAIGHPVVGDDRYGGVRQTLPMARPFLHAEHLGFTHPGTGDAMAFDSALPPDLAATLDSLT